MGGGTRREILKLSKIVGGEKRSVLTKKITTPPIGCAVSDLSATCASGPLSPSKEGCDGIYDGISQTAQRVHPTDPHSLGNFMGRLASVHMNAETQKQTVHH